MVIRHGKKDQNYNPSSVDETDRKWGIFEP